MRTGPTDRSFSVGVSEADGVCWPGKRTCPINSNTGEVVVTHVQKLRERDVDGQQGEACGGKKHERQQPRRQAGNRSCR